ncbi:uncharacterized protein LOC134835774 isoform X1 [Culicoides brevitarsis]|uniref:uncharacterized protein LOC134835774 isoform X1 n=1 Tax=Culicoides brevitarsis TaxID=469753 RepID=UPI00307B43CD
MSVFSLKLRNSGSRKCAMPNCLTGTTAKSNKKYVAVPKQFRERWLAAAGINKKYSPYTKIFFCQDHFDLDYTFSIAEDLIKVSDHLYITEDIIPKPTSEIQDNSWTLKVRRVPGPIPDASDEPVTRPHFNFNNDAATKQRDDALSNWHASLAQFGMSGQDYQEDAMSDDMGEDDGDDQGHYESNQFHGELRSEFKEEPELNDENSF